MHCQIRSPDRTFFDGEATMVVARSSRGEFAVMEDHAPLLASIRSGPLRVKTVDEERVFACFGGSLRVSTDAHVIVLVEDAVPLEEIDVNALTAEAAPEARRAILRGVAETYG
jgi:F-type H+-transporting ATPase subunit epsilon